MRDPSLPRDDIAGLQADLGGEVPFGYIDLQRHDDIASAMQRWPFLMALRRTRQQAAQRRQDEAGGH